MQKVTTEFIDDIDGSEAERTFTFAVDGVSYEIDLSAENIKEFNEAIAGFVESARKVGRTPSATGRRTRAGGTVRASVDREQTRAVREWARQHNYSVSDRGRISAEIMAAFQAAHPAAA